MQLCKPHIVTHVCPALLANCVLLLPLKEGNKHTPVPCRFSKTSRKEAGALYTATRSNETDLNLAEDVLRERERAHVIEPGEENPIVLRELRKEFHNPKKVAVQNLSLAIAKGECFGYAVLYIHTDQKYQRVACIS